MPFHFPLDAIVRLRRAQERTERLKLQAILSELSQARRQLDFIAGQFLESRRRFQLQMGQETYGSVLQFEDVKSDRVDAARRALEVRIFELEEALLQQLEVFAKARQGREVIENLRDRKFDIYRQTRSRRERQEIDDLFLMRLDLVRDE